MKIGRSCGPLGVVVDEVEGGIRERNMNSFLQHLLDVQPCSSAEQAAQSGFRDVPHLADLKME